MPADNGLLKTLARGLSKPGTAVGQKAVNWIRPANVPMNIGDGTRYNAPWQMITGTGRPVSEQAVLQLSAAMACVRLLSGTIATLPLDIFRRLGNGERKSSPDHVLYELLHNQPNPDMTATDFWQVMVSSLLLQGNAFAEKLYFNGRLVALEPLEARRVTWSTDSNGDLIFYYAGTGTNASSRRRIQPDRLWHIPAFTLDGKIGISPICYGASVFGSALAADDASAAVFSNGMTASGFVTSKEFLSPEHRQMFRDNLATFSAQAVNNRKVMILENGMTYTPLGINPEDAQLLETRSFSIEEICRWFGVPPTLIGHGDKTSNWGTGLEQQNIAFLTYSLTPWLRKIEQSIRKSLLPASEKQRYFAEFNVSGLLRGDSAARQSQYSTYVNNGIMTRDEVRRLENLPAMGGNAGILTVQTAMGPLDKIGETDQTAPPVSEEPPVEDQ